MFKFKNYPELINYHNAYTKLGNASTKTLIKIVDQNKIKAQKKFDLIGKKIDEIEYEYAKAVFNILIEKKPKILNRRTNSYELWDDVIGTDFDKIPDNQKVGLVILVEENGGIYRLPPEYYDKAK